jgi:hypothetical protein
MMRKWLLCRVLHVYVRVRFGFVVYCGFVVVLGSS